MPQINQHDILNPSTEDTGKPLVFSYSVPEYPPLKRFMIRAIETAGGGRRLKRLYYDKIDGQERPHVDFFDLVIDAMQLTVETNWAQLQKVPKEGPVLFVANHPFGVLDGITLTWLAKQVRPDVKVLAHSTLCQIPSAKPNLLPIDFGKSDEAQRITLGSRVAAQSWLRGGGAVGIFPGGGVSTSLRPFRGEAVDPPWHPFTAKLIKGAKATVIPIYFSGQNSRLFQLASHISYTLRVSLMFHETARLKGNRLQIGIGDPIPHAELSDFSDRQSLVRHLRAATLGLARILPGASDHPVNVTDEFHFPKGWS